MSAVIEQPAVTGGELAVSTPILILGAVAQPSRWDTPGANIPMSKWLRGLVDGLRQEGVNPQVTGHFYQARWPRGKFFTPSEATLDPAYVTHPIRYSNLPGVRDRELAWRYGRNVRQFASGRREPGILLTYNPYPWHLAAARWFRRAGGTWVNLVLDYDEKDLGPDWSRFRQICGEADGHVFLSWWGFGHCKLEPKLHLDAGCEAIHFDPAAPCPRQEKRIVFYGGKINSYGGADLMAETFLRTRGEDVEFWVCGRGQSEALSRAAASDPRIRLFGFVDDEKLHRLSLQATVFFNPRDPSFSQNRLIFPSKVLHYLSYGRPVVSTWTDGLAPEYGQLLAVSLDASSDAMARKLEETLALPEEQLRRWREGLYRFLASDRSWRRQARRLLEFAKSCQRNQAR